MVLSSKLLSSQVDLLGALEYAVAQPSQAYTPVPVQLLSLTCTTMSVSVLSCTRITQY